MPISIATKSARPRPRRASTSLLSFSLFPPLFRVAKTSSASLPSFSAVFSRGSRPNLSTACRNSSHRSAGTSFSRRKSVQNSRSLIRTTKSLSVNPNARRMSMQSATSSISAARSDSPMMSQFNWKCSRRRPRCCFSYRKNCPIENHLSGFLNSRSCAAITRASVGVSSGRSATSRSPLSVKLKS